MGIENLAPWADGKLAAALPTSPVPEKLQELQMEAVQSLLGLSSVSGGAGASSAWAHWEHSGHSRADACVRKKLSAGDVAQSRLRVPGPLFELLFDQSAKVVLQAAPTNIGHFIAASGLERNGFLLQGESVRQLFADLSAEPEDVLVLSRKGAAADGTPIVLCALAKAGPAARSAATRSAAGSPASPPAQGPAVPALQATPQACLAGYYDYTSEEEGEAPLQLGGGAAHSPYDEPVAPATVSAAEGAGAFATALMAATASAGAGGDAASAGGTSRVAGAAKLALAGRGSAALDHDTAVAAAALAAAADDEVETGNTAVEDTADPEWQAKPKARGRPRKRRPAGAAGGSAAQKQRQADGSELVCAHCGTSDTPRWWKDNFPMGTLCNACGIWLKRHGYPRPVQFFVQPGGGGAPPRPKAARREDGPSGASSRLVEGSPPPDVEYYLINGRPKRRRTTQGSTQGAALPPSALAAAPSSSNADAGGPVQSELLDTSLLQASDPAINYEAGGGRVFVVRRKLVKGEEGDATAAALVHFGWAPSARAAHEMYDKVVQYSEASPDVTVDDYELLTDCKATATLQLRRGREVGSWDALVKDFVDSL
ncbi:hypothetical protein N2152v2_003415 [Parachlorella kessleri]